jgi:hypothetical protein
VRLSLIATSATIWPTVSAPDDRWWWVWSIRWNENWQGKPKYSEKTCASATLSTTNPIWPDLGSNPGRRVKKPATNRLSYGTANKNVSTVSPCYTVVRYWSLFVIRPITFLCQSVASHGWYNLHCIPFYERKELNENILFKQEDGNNWVMWWEPPYFRFWT